ncbi:unnamed protein product [Paramecium sonneborni]|uniref:Transmembrane protein n=1 Tax=Paramecium sonneborni TaxID=65129 RepID=A0A8S1LM19_9CILI|nr:unnamed protein product [Paramecium sonneborni]
MKNLLFINQNNYFEEILIQILFTLQATGIGLYLDSLISIIYNCSFIVAFVILEFQYPKATLFRFWYHHHFHIALPILIQNQQLNITSLFNVLLIVILALLLLFYTEKIGEIQIYKTTKIFNYTFIMIAFSIHHLNHFIFIICIIVYDCLIILQVFGLRIVTNQEFIKFQILTLISMTRLIVFLMLFLIQIKNLLLIVPLLLFLLIQILDRYIHYQIQDILQQQPYKLSSMILLQFTYQLGLYIGLLYISQILVTHSKDCDNLDCFCNKDFSINQQETWKSPKTMLKQSLNEILCEILRQYKFQQMADSEEYLLLLSRIEIEYRNDKLFETLIRSSKLSKTTFYGYTIFPYQFRIQYHRDIFYHKLQSKIEGVRLNSFIYYTYCNLVEQVGQLIVQLLNQKQQILTMFIIQYQNPIYYLYHNRLFHYISQYEKCESLLQKILLLNPQSLVTQNLVRALYSMITFQEEKLNQIQINHNLLSVQIDSLWAILNDRQCCYVQCKYEKGLVMLNHSVLFTQLMEENGIKSDFVGEYIDKLISSPFKEVHQRFLNRLINEGKPRLLNNGIQQFFINTNRGYMKQIDSLVRLGQSMEYLTFMTIMGYKQEETCGKILLSNFGTIYSYSELAVQQLNLDKILKLHHKININMKFCIPQSQNLNELNEGFILIPKINLAQKDEQSNKISTTKFDQASFYKYYLKYPKKCFVFFSIYKFSTTQYDDGNLQYETLQIYQSNEIKDIEIKMLALELMLKQIMLNNNIQTDAYITSYTSFKSIIPETKNFKQHSPKSNSEIQEINDQDFIISNESIHIQQEPQNVQMYQFIGLEQNQIQIDQKNNQINHSSFIANSFQIQDQLLSSRRFNDFSVRDSKRESQQLIHQNLGNLQNINHQEKVLQEEDENQDVDSPEETKEYIQMEVSIKDINGQYLKEQIDWIRSLLKLNKNQLEKQKKLRKSIHKKGFHKKLTLEQQSSTIKSTDSQKGLINHAINGMIQSNSHQFYSIFIIALIYIILLLILIILSIIQLQKELHHIYLDSSAGQFSITLLQNINQMEIAIHLLSTNSTFGAPQFYIYNSTDDYIHYVRTVNNRQYINPEFLQKLEYTPIKINHTFSNYGVYEYITFNTRRYLVDSLPLVFHRISEVVEFRDSKFNIFHMEESYFTLNYPTYFNLSANLINSTDQEMNQTKDAALNIALIYVITGFSSCMIIVIFIGLAEIQIAKWRVSIVRTYFLFQNLQSSIIEQENEILNFLTIDELQHMKCNIIKLDKQTQQVLKNEERLLNKKLKQSFWAKQLILIILLGTLELLYFIPYYKIYQSSVNQLISFHEDLYKLGLTQLSFSNKLVYFIQQYANPYNNVNPIIFNQFDTWFQNYQDQYLFELPFDELFDATSFINIVNDNICEIDEIVPMNNLGYKCPYILQDGYSKFVVSSENLLNVMQSEFSNFSLGLKQIMNQNDFLEIIIAYGFVFPQFNKNRDKLYENQKYNNEKSNTQAILMAVFVMIALTIVFIAIIFIISKQFLAIIKTVKQTLLLFSKDQIAQNKHLVQILSKEVTFD